MVDEMVEQVPCPICGKDAEKGCLYAAGRGDGMQWLPGSPGWKKSFKAEWGGGLRVGEFELFVGSFVRGIYCKHCQRLILDGPDEPKRYYPDLRE